MSNGSSGGRIDYNYIIKTTPGLIRAAIILVLTGVIVLFAIMIALAVFRGTPLKFGLGGIEIGEYRSPDVQKCATLTASLSEFSHFDENGLEKTGSQISEIVKALQTNVDLSIKNRSQVNLEWAKVSDAEIVKHTAHLDSLRKQHENIIATRTQLAKDVITACSTNRPSG